MYSHTHGLLGTHTPLLYQLWGSRSNDTSEAMSMPRAETLVSNTAQQKKLRCCGEMTDFRTETRYI